MLSGAVTERRRRNPPLPLTCIVALICACTDSVAPSPRSLTIFTQNLYLGAALGPILNATPVTLPFAVSQAFAQVQATNFPERAERLAHEIAAAHPDLVALQEVALYRRQSPGDAITGGTTPATTVVLDFQAVLLAALSARGLTFVPVATRTGSCTAAIRDSPAARHLTCAMPLQRSTSDLISFSRAMGRL